MLGVAVIGSASRHLPGCPLSFIDALCFGWIFCLGQVGMFWFPSSDKSVSRTYRLETRPAPPTLQAPGAHPQRSRHATPLHSISNAESVSEGWLPGVLLVCPFAAFVWLRRSLRVRGFSQWIQCSASCRNCVSIRATCRPEPSPQNGVFKCNINQFHSWPVRFRAAFSFESAQILQFNRNRTVEA